jgi:mono/diheme cytochrome c family protein
MHAASRGGREQWALRRNEMAPKNRPRTYPVATLLLLAAMTLGGVLLAQASDIDTGEGEVLYGMHCAVCHQAAGTGIPAAFPPLAGHVPEIVNLEGGRTYPILVVLYGLSGAIEVHGQAYASMMPPMGYLEDEQIADVLNYVATAWENAADLAEGFEPYTAEEVAEERGRELTMDGVHEIRTELGLE